MKASISIVFALLVLGSVKASAEDFQSAIDPTLLRDVKITPQMKYMTSQEAFEQLSQDPDILFVDVRDPVEVRLFGHPALIDAIIPIRAQSTVFDEDLKEWVLKDNPNFIMYMEDALAHFRLSKADRIIVTCGSGWRSAEAARRLHDAGFTDVWHIPDGYAGEEKPGVNLANAWKLAGLPWSYDRVYGSNRLRIVE